MSRSTVLGVVVALVAVAAVPAVTGASGPAHARASAATCPATFTVLHSDHIGTVSFPAGQYRIARNQLSCSTAAQLFSRFLNDYDGVLPAPWQLIGNIRRFQSVGSAREFQVTPLAARPSSLTCPGSYTVLSNDHIGPMSVPAGRWQINLLSTRGLSCNQAAQQLTTFLDYDWSGRLPVPWTMNVARRSFQTSATNGFRITYLGSAAGGGGHNPSNQVRCPGTFQVLHNDRIGSLPVPKGPYVVYAWGTVSCKQATVYFAQFLSAPGDVLPTPWVEVPDLGSFILGGSGFRIKAAA